MLSWSMLIGVALLIAYMRLNSNWYLHLAAWYMPDQRPVVGRTNMVQTTAVMGLLYSWLLIGMLILGSREWIYYTCAAGMAFAYAFAIGYGWIIRKYLLVHRREMTGVAFVMPLVIALGAVITSF